MIIQINWRILDCIFSLFVTGLRKNGHVSEIENAPNYTSIRIILYSSLNQRKDAKEKTALNIQCFRWCSADVQTKINAIVMEIQWNGTWNVKSQQFHKKNQNSYLVLWKSLLVLCGSDERRRERKRERSSIHFVCMQEATHSQFHTYSHTHIHIRYTSAVCE